MVKEKDDFRLELKIRINNYAFQKVVLKWKLIQTFTLLCGVPQKASWTPLRPS